LWYYFKNLNANVTISLQIQNIILTLSPIFNSIVGPPAHCPVYTGKLNQQLSIKHFSIPAFISFSEEQFLINVSSNL